MAAPFTAFTWVKKPFEWSPEADATFQALKQRFAIPQMPDVGVGPVLSLRAISDQKLHPCAFFSLLSPAKLNFDIGKCKLLAVELVLEE